MTDATPIGAEGEPSSTLLADAAVKLRDGNPADAERLARVVATRTPGEARAWRILAAAAQAQGHLSDAAEVWARAVGLEDDALSEFEYGQLLATLGRHSEAADHLGKAVQHRPDWFSALAQWGNALGAAGRPEGAADAFRSAAHLRPDVPQIHHNLGVALLQSGKTEDGIAALQHALTLQPLYPEACYNLGNGHATLGHREDAIAYYRRAVSQRPDYADAYHNLGLHLTEDRRPDEAVPYLQQAVRLRPGSADGHNCLGIALEALGRFDEAEAAYHAALRLDPRHADAHGNLGNLNKARGRLTEALACYQVALWIKPDSVSIRWNRSLTLLLKGDWGEGWAEYEARLRKPNGMARSPSDQPIWDSTPGGGRTILLWAEQGLGDTVQFCRYAPLVRELGFRVLLYVPRILVGLLKSLRGVDRLVPEGTEVPAHDVQCPLMSLPDRLGTTIDNVPAGGPYLAADDRYVTKWKDRVAGLGGYRVGLCWQGNPHHLWDRHRSARLWELAPLGRLPGIRLVSLQQGPGRDQVARHPDLGVLDLGPTFDSVDDLAGAVQLLDLVITVDTATAHMAGALGRPVWVLVAAMADWRWLAGRPDTPWYPTMRLFRQPSVGDWSSPIQALAEQFIRTGHGSDVPDDADGPLRGAP